MLPMNATQKRIAQRSRAYGNCSNTMWMNIAAPKSVIKKTKADHMGLCYPTSALLATVLADCAQVSLPRLAYRHYAMRLRLGGGLHQGRWFAFLWSCVLLHVVAAFFDGFRCHAESPRSDCCTGLGCLGWGMKRSACFCASSIRRQAMSKYFGSFSIPMKSRPI